MNAGSVRLIPVRLPCTHVFGDYWDVYRMAFLSGKQVIGDSVSDLSESLPGLVARAWAG